MQTQAAVDHPDNRRRHARRSVVWSGQLQSGTRDVDCVILNVSAGGARIRVNEPVDDEEPVALRSVRLGGFLGKIVWQYGRDIGISFYARPEAVARRIAESLPGLQPATGHA